MTQKKQAAKKDKGTYNIVKDLEPLAINVKVINIDPKNPREGHDIQGIADSLAKYGQRKPIIVNKSRNNYIEAGTGTFRAATEILGWTHIAAVFVQDDHNAAAGYNLADNRLTDLSYFNPEMMIEMALSVDGDVPGMTSIREMIAFVDQEPEFDEGGDLDSEFKSVLSFTLDAEDYGRFIVIKDALGEKRDEPVFLEMLALMEKSMEALPK